MTTCQDVQAKLSDYVDGLVSKDERVAIDLHLAACAACKGLVRDLERVRAAARQLGPMEPPDHIWLTIAGQIRLESPTPLLSKPAAPPRPPIAWRQWIGLAAALLLITAGWYFFTELRNRTPSPTAGSNAAATGTVQAVNDELTMALEHYDKAIAQLQQLASTKDGAIDPDVAATLSSNLVVVDKAITDSRAALTTEPQSMPARESLLDALRQKVGLLQATVELINEMRKGNQDGAARIVNRVGKS
jgi:Putative zinc-finger